MCSDIFDFQSVVVVGSLTRKSQAEIPFAVGVVGSQSKALGRGRIGVFFLSVQQDFCGILIAHSAKYFQIM